MFDLKAKHSTLLFERLLEVKRNGPITKKMVSSDIQSTDSAGKMRRSVLVFNRIGNAVILDEILFRDLDLVCQTKSCYGRTLVRKLSKFARELLSRWRFASLTSFELLMS